jgi:rhamnulose-1-phosphate aldolase/alcohol dehydrogenase
MSTSEEFRHVSYLWDEKKAASLNGDEVALLLYRSNLLGSDLRLTNYGGGNTSVKVVRPDPLTGAQTRVMYIKGSGGDLGTLQRNGLAGLYLDRLIALKKRYRGLPYEDEMVELFSHCIYDLHSKAPSIDTPLHAFLPFAHIDHLHPDAAIAIAASKEGEQITEQLFGGAIGWVDWQRPGFDLALKMEACLQQRPDIRGIILGGHGLFSWGDTAYESYINTLQIIEKCAAYLEQHYREKREVFGGMKVEALPQPQRRAQAALIAPVLRGLCSSQTRMIGHFSDDPRVLEFINSQHAARLSHMGTSCPDHFLRTKISPLLLELSPQENLEDGKRLRDKLQPVFADYRAYYQNYYETHRHPDSPPMRDPNPVVILYPGVGLFAFAKNKQTARVAAEFYTNAINVMKGAEAISQYVSLPMQEAFDIEYWSLEEAKLQRLPRPKPLTGKIALVTGSAGGIGKAIVEKLIKEGACAIVADIHEERLQDTAQTYEDIWGKDHFCAVRLDVTQEAEVQRVLRDASLAFGGIDIVVNNAGLSISKALDETTLDDWDLLQDVLVKGQFLMSRGTVEIMRRQGLDGDIINIVSKNALVSGPRNVGYGTAKAAQLHMSRLMAAELGTDRIRVNVVNPDAVIQGSHIWSGGWAEGRAKAYGISVDELPGYYAKRTLLNETILPDDIANAVFVYLSGLLDKSTGNILNVDGGIAAAFVR